jgi:hypothetical protein
MLLASRQTEVDVLTVDDLTELRQADDTEAVVPDDLSQLSDPDLVVHNSRGSVLAAVFFGLIVLLAAGLPAHGKTNVSTTAASHKAQTRKITTLKPDDNLTPLGELDTGLAPGEDVSAILEADGTVSGATSDGSSGAAGANGSIGGSTGGATGRAGTAGQDGQPGAAGGPNARSGAGGGNGGGTGDNSSDAPASGNTSGVNRGSQNSQTGGQTNTGGNTRTGDANASGGSGDGTSNSGGGNSNEATQPGQSSASDDGQAQDSGREVQNQGG